MNIEKTKIEDIDTLMAIFEGARAFMVKEHNPNQWGPKNWPPRHLIEQDIAQGKSYVVKSEGKIVGTFFCDTGEDIEPTYRHIEGEGWMHQGPYAVIHRIASNFEIKGIGEIAVAFALSKCAHIRVDTHKDNKPMQNLLKKLGFCYRGIIYVGHSDEPRLAFER